MRLIRTKITELLGIDIRSLALYRVLASLCMLRTLSLRIPEIEGIYTDYGALPRATNLALYNRPAYTWSLHFISGTYEFQLFLFLLGVAGALSLLLGFHTRKAAVFCTLFLVSLDRGNPFISVGGDMILLQSLFWAMFLPLGACFSIDRLRKKEAPEQGPVLSFFSTGALLLLVYVYVFSAFFKNHPAWWVDGTSVYYAMNVDLFLTPFGKILREFPALMKVGTFATIWIEQYGPLLAFVPVFTGPLRTLTVFMFLGLHLGFRSALDIGTFSWVCMTVWTLYLPGWFWDRAGRFERGGVVLRAIERIEGWFGRAAHLAGEVRRRKLPDWVTGPRDLALHIVGVYCLLVMLLLNLYVMGFRPPELVPKALIRMADMFQFWQGWAMFAPYPLVDDGWMVMPGRLKDGSEVDLFKGGGPVDVEKSLASSGKISFEKPLFVGRTFKSVVWKRFLAEARREHLSIYRESYAKYLCRAWNDRVPPEKRLVSLKIFWVFEYTLPNYRYSTPQPTILTEHTCEAPPEVNPNPTG